MKILLVHDADKNTVKKIYEWKKSKKGLGEYYHLSTFSQEINFEELKSKIERSKKVYGILKVIFLKTNESEKYTTSLKQTLNSEDFEIINL